MKKIYISKRQALKQFLLRNCTVPSLLVGLHEVAGQGKEIYMKNPFNTLHTEYRLYPVTERIYSVRVYSDVQLPAASESQAKARLKYELIIPAKLWERLVGEFEMPKTSVQPAADVVRLITTRKDKLKTLAGVAKASDESA